MNFTVENVENFSDVWIRIMEDDISAEEVKTFFIERNYGSPSDLLVETLMKNKKGAVNLLNFPALVVSPVTKLKHQYNGLAYGFFKHILEKKQSQLEAGLWLVVDRNDYNSIHHLVRGNFTDATLHMICPVISSLGGAHVTKNSHYKYCPKCKVASENEKTCPICKGTELKDFYCVVDYHSHNSMPPFWSGADNTSQIPDKQINVVIGHINTGGEFRVSYTNGKTRFDLDPCVIFDNTALLEQTDLGLFENWMYWHEEALKPKVPAYGYGYEWSGDYWSRKNDIDQFRKPLYPTTKKKKVVYPVPRYNLVSTGFDIPKDTVASNFDPADVVPFYKKKESNAWLE